ncbi:DUF2141 domain-containing protein [Amphiplicatus metriothermophilus]|uniref:DUF2141 domain-containing protein n=1 Tax=Amphiplicatus metriothermophilus TaxID=1519374 RepID=A0A239PJZ4_9PROT|nr:DUF2141 domain-containing protein [Amphiplicatus metriothermophilus]MBB5517534.1 uncharacterized protein (DUF2141 family) [Amphiplicatus metriothermophilus]SNT68131.1 hypothetical protein SAMN06297382_0627 [Amphiplicatus metriothermophilus]
MAARAFMIAMAAWPLAAGPVSADGAPGLESFAEAEALVRALGADAPAGAAVRLMVYDDPGAFLEETAAKYEARLDDEGVARLSLAALAPGPYAFVAYLDENGDGRLNRGGLLGRPKEPYAFSNGVKPKLRRPRFEEAKIDVAPGAVVVITLEN